jgi:hypothetical protein
MNQPTPSYDAWRQFRRVYWSLAAIMAILLALLAALGFGPGGRKCPAASPTAATSAPLLAAHDTAAGYACLKG